MIRLYKKDNTGYKDFGDVLFSTNSCAFDFVTKTLTISGVDYKIPSVDELTTFHSFVIADTSVTLEYYSVLFINNGDADVFINNSKLKAGNSLAFGGYDKRIVQTFAIAFVGGSVKRLDIIEEIAKQ